MEAIKKILSEDTKNCMEATTQNTRQVPKFSILMNLENLEAMKKYIDSFDFPEPEPPTQEEINKLTEQKMLSCGIPVSKINASKKEIRPAKLWTEICKSLQENGSLFLYGAVGCGKSCILSCIAREYVRAGRKTLKYISMYDFALQVSKSLEDHFNYARLLEDLFSFDVLMLDDIGALGLNESQKTALIFLLNRVCDQDTQLIIASNCDIKDIDSYFDQRIGSRLKEKCAYFKLEGKDRRGRK